MKAAFVFALGFLLLTGCGHKRKARNVPPPPPRPSTSRPGSSKANYAANEASRTPPPADAPALYVETGIASWYGHPYHGRVAANGEVYDMEKLTAAHRTLPFDTWVRVINLLNQKVVEVRITDRGPFVGSRVIDLSHAAARAIDLIGPGTAKVRLEITSMPETTRTGIYAVQVGAFRVKENAERERIRMAALYGAAKLTYRDGEPGLWRVLVGAEKTENGADTLCAKIRNSGERNAFVVRLDS